MSIGFIGFKLQQSVVMQAFVTRSPIYFVLMKIDFSFLFKTALKFGAALLHGRLLMELLRFEGV